MIHFVTFRVILRLAAFSSPGDTAGNGIFGDSLVAYSPSQPPGSYIRAKHKPSQVKVDLPTVMTHAA